MFETKHAATVDLKADEQGHIEAVFSTFGVVDSDGDILVREAFTDGQAVPLVWAHDWSMPIGKGTIRTDSKRAIFDGQFFTDTTAGRDAYQTVKAMGELQEFSWGFRILDAEQEVRDGEPVRIITKAEVFEVSPVLVGANRETYTLALKGRRRLSRGQIEGAITVLSALLGDDADDIDAEDAPSPAEDDRPADEPVIPPAVLTLAEDGERLAAELAAFTAQLKDADHGTRADARRWARDIAARMHTAKQQLDSVLRRADEEAELDLNDLFRVTRELDARYGAIEEGVH